MIKKILALLLITSFYAQGMDEKNIKQEMNTRVNKVLSILQNDALSPKQKEQQSVLFIDDIFDYTTMSQISLGRMWTTLKPNEKTQFTKAFEEKLKHSYLDKLRLYNNQKVIIGNPKKVKSNRIAFDVEVIGVDDTYKVEYLFYQNKKDNQWYIYDVILVGVSIIQTYRNQFAEFLKTKSIVELTKSL
jgi:phospholipid transport system substrate-binding protein